VLDSVRLTLLVGPAVPIPAPREVVDALTDVSVTESTDGPSGFQLKFSLEPRSPLQTIFVVATGTVPLLRVILLATVNGFPHVLVNGVATRTEVSSTAGRSTLTVTGEDLTRVMDYIDFSGVPYPGMPPEARVVAILAKYVPFGLIPVVIPTLLPDVDIPVEKIPRHQGTDLAYVRALAEDAGYVFYIEPTPAPGASVAYWGPEVRVGPPAPAITLDMGAHGNVASLSFSFDGEGATMPILWIQEKNSKAPIPIPVPDVSILNPPLGLVPPFPKRFVPVEGVAKESPVRAALLGLSQAARSRDAASASGSLEVSRYGSLLRPRRLVGERGAGDAFNGLWYVKQVSHEIKRGSYSQSFSLVRNGLMSTVPRVFP